MSIFLLFVAEINQQIDFQNLENQTVSFFSNSFIKQHHLVKSFEKETSHLNPDFFGYPEEITVDDFSFSNALDIIIIATVTGFGYLIYLFYRQEEYFFYRQKNIFQTIRRFILLRSIRI